MDELYTRAEAEALLPRLTILLQDLRDRMAAFDSLREALDAVPVAARDNGRAVEATALADDIANATHVVQQIIEEIAGLGVEVKDPRTGLVDFRSLHEGRVIYLCWRLGEPRILYWHELDSGFAGRQPLD